LSFSVGVLPAYASLSDESFLHDMALLLFTFVLTSPSDSHNVLHASDAIKEFDCVSATVDAENKTVSALLRNTVFFSPQEVITVSIYVKLFLSSVCCLSSKYRLRLILS
jgi:hypothetical protein